MCTCLVAQLCPTLCNPWTVTSQAPLSMGFSRQEYWSGLPLSPPPGDLSWPRDWTWVSCIAGRFFTIWAAREAQPVNISSTNKKHFIRTSWHEALNIWFLPHRSNFPDVGMGTPWVWIRRSDYPHRSIKTQDWKRFYHPQNSTFHLYFQPRYLGIFSSLPAELTIFIVVSKHVQGTFLRTS